MISFADEKIFPDEFFNKEVSYQKAAEVLNSEGKPYDEYGFHDEECDIEAIFYEGYKDTKIFAYMGVPKNKGNEKLPAIVLLHGGLGKAKREWVERWNKCGFVAIAPDLYGCGPEDDESFCSKKKRHPYAGFMPWGEKGFLEDYKNSGMYQTIVSVIYAHNILRSLSCVDCSKIGITGISWGGVVTTITTGVDSRFAFASPVYGCGHLAETKTYFTHNILDEGMTTKWDPAYFAAKAKMPVLYVNGDSDGHFSVDVTSLTCLDTPNAALSIYHKMEHGQAAGDSVQQIYNFAKNVTENKDAFVKVIDTKQEKNNLSVTVKIPSGTELKEAVLYYITTEVLHHNGGEEIGWQKITANQPLGENITFSYPDEAAFGYASVIDVEGNIISTPYTKLK